MKEQKKLKEHNYRFLASIREQINSIYNHLKIYKKSWSRRNNWVVKDNKNTTNEATHTIKTARQDIMYKSKQAIISGADCV